MRVRWLPMVWLFAMACDDGGGSGADAAARIDAGADRVADQAPSLDAKIGDAPASDAPIVDSPIVDSPAIDLFAGADSHEAGEVPPLTANLDLVFVVDNSGSMAEEQANLARNFPLFLQALGVTPGESAPDVRIAVVSSDLGAGAGSFQTQCRPGGDQGVFCQAQLPTVGVPGMWEPTDFCQRCGIVTAGGRFLRVRNPNFPGSLYETFSCMARLGTSGCGFEHPVGALIKALGNSQNGPFLRPDAYLAFVIITDEDDCTAAPDSGLFASAILGQDASLRCALEGHSCAGAHNSGATDVNFALGQCRDATDGALLPVASLVNQVLALKPDPTRIIAAGIFGWPLPGQEATARYLITGAGPPSAGSRSQQPICQSAGNGSATAGYRVKRFVESFPNHTALSICQNDFRPALEQIAARIRAATGN